jgi:hypothetical protein
MSKSFVSMGDVLQKNRDELKEMAEKTQNDE